MITSSAQKPPHVPDDLVAEVDIYDLPGADPDPQLAWAALARPGRPPLVWTPRNGGHWIVTSGRLALKLLADTARLSSESIRVPPVPAIYPLIPSEADAPDHRHYRSIIMPFFMPRVVKSLADGVRTVARSLVEAIAPRGECEFMGEFARHVPILVFLRLVDLPATDREWLLARSEIMVRSNDLAAREKAQEDVVAYLGHWIEQRRQKPGSDLISAIVQGQVGSRPMSEAEVMGECMTVLFGGLDTVASMIGFMIRFLSTSPMHRQQLIADPALIPAAVEELMRRHSLVSVARRVVAEIDIDGVLLHPGDMVLLSTALHGLDESVWKDPLEVDFSRPRQPIATFGAGPHTCVGAALARSELVIMLEEWLARIPNFTIAADDDGRVLSGTVNCLSSLKLSWGGL